MPSASSASVAPQPVQLTFDRFALGFNHQFTADPGKIRARPCWPRFNPLVIRGMQEAENALLLEAMAAECLRLEPDTKILLADGAWLRDAHASGRLPEIAQADLLLLHQMDNLNGPARGAMRFLVRERIERSLLTVLAFQAATAEGLRRFCARTCTSGLSVRGLPPGPSPRLGISLGYLRINGPRIDDTTHTTLTTVPWECAADIKALGERILHAAYSPGRLMTPEKVALLCRFLGRRASESTASAPPRCCLNRLHHTLPRGQWPPAADESVPPTKTVTAEFRHTCATVELRQQIWPHRFLLELRADHVGRRPARFEIDVTLQPQFAVKVRDSGGWTAHEWGLTAGLPIVGEDPFINARYWTYHALVPVRPRRKGNRRPVDPGLGATMREVGARLREAACSAVALLDGNARKIALRYPNHMRVWLYRQLAADTSGRLVQVAVACPGALTFAYGLGAFGRSPGSRLAVGRFLRGAIEGRPLNSILDEAVTAWAAWAVRRASNPRTPEGLRRYWQWFAELQSAERESMQRAQRQLIRRAGFGVPSLTLWLPPPPAFAPEDIPTGKRPNARWFRMMKCLRRVLVERDDVSPDQVHDLCMFVSLHAVWLHRCDEACPGDYARITRLLDYARALNVWPRRSTSATRYVAAADTWHDHFEEIRQVAQLAAESGERMVDADGNPLPFPEPPCPGWRSGEDTLVPLRTVEEVLVEGNRMHNCIASRVGEALLSRAFLYHGEVGGKPLSIQIAREGEGYRLVEAAGLSNARLRAPQKRVLREFLFHLRSDGKCSCSSPVLTEE